MAGMLLATAAPLKVSPEDRVKLERMAFSPSLPIQPGSVTGYFDRLVARHGPPRIRFHDVRHTHATLLLKAGVPIKVVAERLGHASPGFTLNVYQHVLPGMQAEAAETFDELLDDEPDQDDGDAGANGNDDPS